MVTKNQYIPITVKRLHEDQPGFLSIFFERPANFVFEAGDWIDIAFENRNLKGGITYSISSAPTESDIRISFREGVSEFKRALQSVKPGDVLRITQYGNDYGFQLKKNQSNVLIAGGIGIAPFRSMIKEAYDTNDQHEIKLIYLSQNESVLFKSELETWSVALSKVTVTHINTKEVNRKKREKLIMSIIGSIDQNFYISGPSGMVESNEHLLIDAGVQVRDIRIDSFSGY